MIDYETKNASVPIYKLIVFFTCTFSLIILALIFCDGLYNWNTEGNRFEITCVSLALGLVWIIVSIQPELNTLNVARGTYMLLYLTISSRIYSSIYKEVKIDSEGISILHFIESFIAVLPIRLLMCFFILQIKERLFANPKEPGSIKPDMISQDCIFYLNKALIISSATSYILCYSKKFIWNNEYDFSIISLMLQHIAGLMYFKYMTK